MTDKYLDKILYTITHNLFLTPDRCNGIVGMGSGTFKEALQILMKDEYVFIDKGGSISRDMLQLTASGTRFFKQGGYKHQTKLKNSPLQANRIAWLSLFIAALAFIISSIVAYLQFKTKS